MATTAPARSDIPARPDGRTRILHTSDWHLGVAVRNEPRDSDHAAVIAEIIDIATDAAPDLIVHTGDLFNTARPAMPDFRRAMRALRDLAVIAPVVVLAGNHDSSVVLETLGDAVEDTVAATIAAGGTYNPHQPCPARIRVLHRPVTPDKGAVATYSTASGGRLRLAALPFLHANRVIDDFDTLNAVNASYTDTARKISDLLATSAFTDFDPATDVAVFASHPHITGARTSSEKEIHVSTDYATDPAHLESRYGYLAFGHIHIAQPVAAGRGRYAGSILEVDFGEEGETKQVVLADLMPGRPTHIHDIALRAGRRLHRIRSPYSTLGEHASRIGDGLVEVTVTAEPDSDGDGDGGDQSRGPTTFDIPGFDSLNAAVRAALPNACVVGVLDARRTHITLADDVDIDTTSTESESTMFRTWLNDAGAAVFAKHSNGGADPEQVAAMFDQIHTAITTGADPTLAELDAVLARNDESH